MAKTIYTISNNDTVSIGGTQYTSNSKGSKYEPGDSVFYIPFTGIDDNIKSITGLSAANASIIINIYATNNDICVVPGTYVKTSNKTYTTTIKYTITYNDTTTKICYSKISFVPQINDDTSSCVMTSLNGKTDPSTYLSYTTEKNNLDALVTKKGMIANMREMANQIATKIGSTQALSVNYDLKGGHWDDGYEPRTTFVSSTSYTPKVPRKVGYTFDSWKVYAANGTDAPHDDETVIYSGPTAVEVGTTQNITAVAQWAPVGYKVNIHKNAESSSEFDAINLTYGNNADLSSSNSTWSLTVPNGYQFKGNFTLKDKNNQTITYNQENSFDTIYNLVKTDNESGDNITIDIYPVFVPCTVKITYDLNTTSSEIPQGNIHPTNASLDAGMSNNYYTYGTTFNLPIPVASGYSFDGWWITDNLKNQRVINPTDLNVGNVTFDNSNDTKITLSALWTKNNYHFEFDTQGGILSSEDTIYIQPKGEYTLPTVTRTGYSFSNWTIVNNGNNSKATISDSKITVADNIDTDIVLRANWTASTAKTTVEYWYEDVNSTRTTTDESDIASTTYILNSTEEITDTVTNETLTLSDNGNAISITKDGSPNGSFTIPDKTSNGLTFQTVSFPGGKTVKADGSTVIRLYYTRNIVYYKINDKYSESTFNGGPEPTAVDHFRTTNGVPCLYGTKIIAETQFDDNKLPASGYIANTNSVSEAITSGAINDPKIITITYTRKTFNVKYDLNGCGSFSNGELNTVGDIYVTTAKYNQLLNYYSINKNSNIDSSYWSVNGHGSSYVEDNTTFAVKGDTTLIRIPSYKTYTIQISSEQKFTYGTEPTTLEDTTGLYTISKSVAGSDFPYYLSSATYINYTFKEWQYCLTPTGDYQPLGGNTISEAIIKKLSDTTLYIKAVFTADEPTINGHGVVTTTDGTLKIPLALSENTTTVFIATVGRTTGLGSAMTKDGQESNIPGISDSSKTYNGFNYTTATVNAQDDVIIQITPAKEIATGTNSYITGKPLFAKLTSNTWTYYNSYTASTTDKNSIYSVANGLISDEERRKLALISDEATSVAVAQGQLTDSDTLTSTSDYNDSKEKYAVGSIKVDGTVTTLYGKDTTYGEASNTKYGLVKLGNSAPLTNAINTTPSIEEGHTYPVQMDADGKLGVNVPWTDNQSLPKTTLVVGTNNATTTNASTTLANGNVYLNSVDQKVKTDGSTTDGSATNTSSINITGSGGTTVTSEGSKIIVNSHDDKGTLGGDNNSATSYYVKGGGNASQYLKGNGSWDTPTDTQVKYNDTIVTSINAGNNITITPNSNAISISGTANTEYYGSNGITVGSDASKTEDTTKGKYPISLNTATKDALGGVKVGLIGTASVTDSNGNSTTGTTGQTINGTSSQTVYAPPSSGQYYPVEITQATSSTATNGGFAVVKIPNVTHPTATTDVIGGFKAHASVTPDSITSATSGNYYPVDIVSSGTNANLAVVCIPANTDDRNGYTDCSKNISGDSYTLTVTFTNKVSTVIMYTYNETTKKFDGGTITSLSSHKYTTDSFSENKRFIFEPIIGSTPGKLGQRIYITASYDYDEDNDVTCSVSLGIWS